MEYLQYAYQYALSLWEWLWTPLPHIEMPDVPQDYWYLVALLGGVAAILLLRRPCEIAYYKIRYLLRGRKKRPMSADERERQIIANCITSVMEDAIDAGLIRARTVKLLYKKLGKHGYTDFLPKKLPTRKMKTMEMQIVKGAIRSRLDYLQHMVHGVAVPFYTPAPLPQPKAVRKLRAAS